MDTVLETNIESVLKTLWDYFFGSRPQAFLYNDGSTPRLQPSLYMGYGGAALAFFLSVAGAYIAGATTINQVENSFFSFLEDFQDNDDYIALMDDEDIGK